MSPIRAHSPSIEAPCSEVGPQTRYRAAPRAQAASSRAASLPPAFAADASRSQAAPPPSRPPRR
eukprot:705193-Rhodomonas_salina.2